MFNKIKRNIIIKLKFIPFTQIILSKLSNKINKKYKDVIIRSNNLYRFSKNIVEFVILKGFDIDKFIKKLDPSNRDIVQELLKRIFYIYTHSLIPRNLFFKLEEIKGHIEALKIINNLRDDFPLIINQYEESVFVHDCGLKHLPLDVIENLENKDFIDGGAYIGDSSLIFEKKYNARNIIAFEPDAKNFNFLIRTVKLNNSTKIKPVNKGLGDKVEKLKIKTIGRASSISKKGDLEISITTIDDYAFQNNLDVGVIKLDVEGFALKAIKGAKKIIEKFEPILLISIYHNGDEFFNIINFVKKIKPNYKFKIIKLSSLSLFFETTLIAWTE